MGLAHDGYDGNLYSCEHTDKMVDNMETYTACCSDGASLQFRQQSLLVVIWYCAYNVDESGDAAIAVLLAHLRSQLIEGYSLVCVMSLD